MTINSHLVLYFFSYFIRICFWFLPNHSLCCPEKRNSTWIQNIMFPTFRKRLLRCVEVLIFLVMRKPSGTDTLIDIFCEVAGCIVAFKLTRGIKNIQVFKDHVWWGFAGFTKRYNSSFSEMKNWKTPESVLGINIKILY